MLARVFVAGLLVTVATVILVAFTLLVRSVRARLESFGLNTLVVREMVPPNDPELFYTVDRPDRLAPLADAGEKLRLRQLYLRGQTDWQRDLLVLVYSPEALPILAPWLSPEIPIVFFSESVPEFVHVKLKIQHQSGVAVVRRAPEFFRSLNYDHFVLVPRGWAPEAEKLGFVETTLFRRRPEALPMQRYVEAVNVLFAVDRRSPPQVQSALPMLRELEHLQERQVKWRRLMAGALGFAIALVFGAIAVLEFRQNLYVSALLRSLGAPGRYLFFRHWIESAVLANAAAILGVLAVAFFHRALFGTLGFRGSVLDLAQGNPYWSSETVLILLWVNVGALLSSLPVAVGLRKPVGAILN